MEISKTRWKLLYITWIYSWLLIEFLTAARNIERYDTAYECEGKTLKIECKESELIHLIRANYGRFSITICNEHGNTDWSVNCMSTKSFRVLYSRCNQKQNCSIVASTSQFGDPCPNTLKYLEAHYQCVSVTASPISRQNPLWLTTSQPPIWNYNTMTTSITEARYPARYITTDTNIQQPQKLDDPSSFSYEEKKELRFIKSGGLNDATKEDNLSTSAKGFHGSITSKKQIHVSASTMASLLQESTSLYKPNENDINRTNIDFRYRSQENRIHNTKKNSHKCPRQFVRKLAWNETLLGEIAVQACPGGTHGLARWMCVSTPSTNEEKKAHWFRESPDLSECRSVWLSTLEHRVKNGELILGVSNDLSQVTNHSRELYGGDMLVTAKILKTMALRMAEDIQKFQDSRQRELSVAELLQGAVTTSSNLLDTAQSTSWKDLSYQDQILVATSLLESLEDNAFLLADTLNVEKKVIHERTNLLVEIRVLELQNLEKGVQVFPSSTDHYYKKAKLQNRVELNSKALIENDNKDGFVRLVFMAFDRLDEILRPKNEDNFNIFEKQSRLHVKFPGLTLSPSNITRIVNSKVISASLGKGRYHQLAEPVRLYFQHLILKNVTNPRCVFWDYTSSDWSEDGCIIRHSNTTHTTCECSHLTNFAVLMDINTANRVQQGANEVYVYIGCIISVICSSLVLLTLHLTCDFPTDRAMIHKNFSVCLLVTEILYICVIHQIHQKSLCYIMATWFHFFFLSTLAWTFLEGFQLFIMLIEVFEAEKSRLRWFYLVGYGTPLIIVAISTSREIFRHETNCVFRNRIEYILINNFLVPVIFVILGNTVFCLFSKFMMSKYEKSTLAVKNEEYSQLCITRSRLNDSLIVVLLLTLTWLFGLLYLTKKKITLAYIFTILNTFQGICLLMFHCFKNKEAWKVYQKHLRIHQWLPKCIGCSESTESNSFNTSSVANCAKDLGSLQISSSVAAPDDPDLYSSRQNPNNIFFKTYSRENVHLRFEQEENDHRLPHNYSLRGRDCRMAELENNCNSTSTKRPISPYNHTYTEIRDHIEQQQQQQLHRYRTYCEQKQLDDPVYEEIGRNVGAHCFEVTLSSDISDEDVRRQSDMSRQSSRSYSDHRPLIPYSPASEFPWNFEKIKKQTCEEPKHLELSEPLEKSQDQSRTIAVLDGHTVVCHLQPQLDLYSARGLPPPSYSEC